MLDVMTIDNSNHDIKQAIKLLFFKLINVFKTIILELEHDEKSANKKAVDIVTNLQVSLVLCRVTGETHFFDATVKQLKSQIFL